MTIVRLIRGATAGLLTAALCTAAPAHAAEACPGGAIKLVVANPAGGVGDLVGRLLAEKAAGDLGQPVVVENRAGATTVIGTDYVAKSRPDGCTLLSLTASGVVVSVLRDTLPYRLERDLTPVVGIGSFPMVLAVPTVSRLKSLDDIKALAKSRDGISYSSGGAGSLAHLSAVRLLTDLGVTGTHVPYQGNAPALHALISGQVDLFFASAAEALSMQQGGRLRLLGVTAEHRLPALPDVPTMAELGFAGFNPRLWYALMTPSGTPTATRQRLYLAFDKAIADAEVHSRLRALGFTPEASGPATVSALIRSEATRWGKLIRDNGIRPAD